MKFFSTLFVAAAIAGHASAYVAAPAAGEYTTAVEPVAAAPVAAVQPVAEGATSKVVTTVDSTVDLVLASKKLIAIEHTLSIAVLIPDEVIEKGEKAVAAWLKLNKAVIQTKAKVFHKLVELHEHVVAEVKEDFWDVAECLGAFQTFIASGVFPIPTLLKIKKTIDMLGGLEAALNFLKTLPVETALAILEDLFDDATGFGEVKEKCF